MLPKKNYKSNLEKKRGIFFEYGILVALAISLVAFESGKENIKNEDMLALNKGEVLEEEMAQITRPELPKIKPPKVPVIIEIVTEDEPIIDEPIDWGVETSTAEGINFRMIDRVDETPEPDPTFVIVENMPEYDGGATANFQKHLQSLVLYPEAAAEMGIEGRVYVQFVVNKEGYLVNPTVVRSPDDLLSDAVLKAIKKTKRWTPGEQRGMKVQVTFTVPVNFTLR